MTRLSRRRFVQGVAGGALLLSAAGRPLRSAENRAPTVLTGPDFALTIGELPVNYTGAARTATAVNGQVPAPLLRMRQGDAVTIRVTNRLAARTSIHWHGMIVPADMDGVPGISFAGIAPGETFTYRFKANQYGTYWYHAHSRFQEQVGLYGPIVIDRTGGERHASDREYTLLLSDWTDIDPEHIYATLKRQSDYYNFHKRTAGDFFADVRQQGFKATLADRRMWGQMRMNPTDLVDVSGYAYTYLMNGVTPAGNWTGLFRRGERVRLRIINGSSMSFFDVRIPGLEMKVVAADGQDVEPVTVDEFRIGAAEVYDVIVEPRDDRAYTIFAQSMDRSGYARGTLAPREGMTAEVPAMDARVLLSMADMGMGHDMGHGASEGASAPGTSHDDMPGMHHGATPSSSMSGMDHSATPSSSMPGMDHSATPSSSMSGMDHSATPGSSMPGMNHGATPDSSDMPGMDHSAMPGSSAPGMNHGATPPAAGHPSSPRGAHAPAEYGPTVDSIAAQTSPRLDDPGPGLRDNGRRVLTYADLHTLGGPIDRRGPGREIELHLTGHMERFIWSFNGQKFSEAEPLHFRHGERLRIVLVNDSMMTHPIHLHGMWSELEDEDGQFLVRKHTVTVQPAQRISYLVSADALGRWAYHCHLLYHMEAGMFREVVVSHGDGAMPEHHHS